MVDNLHRQFGGRMENFMRKQPLIFGTIVVAIIGSILSGCNFRMSVKDRTGETQTYYVEDYMNDNVIENTLPLQVVKYEPMTIYQIGKILYNMSQENVDEYLQDQGKNQSFYLGISTNGEGFYTINGELGDSYATVLSLFSNERTLDYYFSNTDINNSSIDTIGNQIQQRFNDAGFTIAFYEKYTLSANALNQLQKDVYDEDTFKLYAPGAERDENGMQTGNLNSWGADDEAYLFTYYMAYNDTCVDSISGTHRIQIVYSPLKQQIVYGYGSICPVFTHNVISSEKVNNLSGNDAIALARKALNESKINDIKIVSIEPVYVNRFGDISFENQTMTLVPAWRIEYIFEKNGKSIKNQIHLNAETGEVYDNTSEL